MIATAQFGNRGMSASGASLGAPGISAPDLSGIPMAGCVAAYYFGAEGEGNWWQPDWNLLLWSEDITNAAWGKAGATADDATHLTFDAQYGYGRQGITTTNGVEYTVSFKAQRVSGNYNLAYSVFGLTPNFYDTLTLTDTLARYSKTVTGDGGNVDFGIQDRNASGHGQIEITDLMVIPGSHTTAECEVLYQTTEAKQVLHDWSPAGANPGERGSDPGADNNDPSITPSCRNLLAAGSTEDWESTWSVSSTVVTADDTTDPIGGSAADRLTVDGASPSASATQTYTCPADGISLVATCYIKAGSSSHSSLVLFDNTVYTFRARVTVAWSAGTPTVVAGVTVGTALDPVNVGAGWWRIGVVSDANLVAASSNRVITYPGGHGQSNDTDYSYWWGAQLEVASSATDYINPSSESLISGWDFQTDDYTVTDPLTLDSDWTFLAVLTPDDNTSVGLFRNGAASPNVSLDANGKVSYAGGGTVASTNAVPIGRPSVIAITKVGTTITHYLNGAVNGSGTSGSGNAFAALRIGYDGTAYYDGEYEAFAAYNRALSPGTILRWQREVVRRWAYDHQNYREMDI